VKDQPLDSLCLNAGLAHGQGESTVFRTVDGFEETIGVNHIGENICLHEYIYIYIQICIYHTKINYLFRRTVGPDVVALYSALRTVSRKRLNSTTSVRISVYTFVYTIHR